MNTQDEQINTLGEQQRPKEKIKEVRHYYYKEKKARFNPGRLFAGLLVVLVGAFLLANKVGLVQLNVKLDVVDMWPVLVVLIGLSMISFRGFFGALIGIIIAVVAASIVFMILFGHLNIKGTSWNDWDFKLEFSSKEIFNNQ